MKKRVLFVCLGNICRSPAAKAIFSKLAADREWAHSLEIDSAGTGGWNVGEPADERMREHAARRGYQVNHRARKFDRNTDFDQFDMIIGMDDENIRRLRSLARNGNDLKKIRRMTEFSRLYGYSSVPDPYYGGEEGFELVMDLLEDALEGLLEVIVKPEFR
ncbi:MAG: low molecular weight protein-tyrosine-phosphatase [Prolixibacteraceae bacterium]|jgi:protein-tyrosine phosphatase|nr:low molecular weight phosphotyrosine protein phosphatase [Prolixibacteraceae bacterium]MDI9563259.1 low molecular weight protein-tyrosine-phosphatase [Bacteroidota bacterium]NLS99341.1 low molecular weight phosphotyrosine protein phosphatase [Bacteroidales bacterium]OQB81089.1 MAG: Low molecular weight protein-tyrosine-phosphatase YfkJ [Bacteroidetes bacterium ADurb.Bin123]HNU78007.1 low molecular weight protein-tyrosine-phosphatase [Prolixibacteraceae bacterium]